MSTNRQMTNVRRWSVVLNVGLVMLGLLIFFFSLYTASLSGLRRQLGLVGGDLSQSVDKAQLYRLLIDVGGVGECSFYRAIKGVPRYIFSQSEQKIKLGRELSDIRLDCGVRYTLAGNTERGLYTMLKAMRYELAGLLMLEQLATEDQQYCGLYETRSSLGLIEVYLESSHGNVRGIVEKEYREIERLRLRIAEQCNSLSG